MRNLYIILGVFIFALFACKKETKLTPQIETYLQGYSVYCIAIDNIGNKWFATNNGIYKYDGTNWLNFNAQNSKLKNNIVKRIAFDKTNNLWADGPIKYDGTNWTDFSLDSLSGIGVSSIIVDNNNFVYYTSFYSGLKYNTTNWSSLNITYNFLTLDNLGAIWAVPCFNFNNSGKIYKYDAGNWVTYDYTQNGILKGFYNSIVFDKSNNIWIAVSPKNENSDTIGGLIKINGTICTNYTKQNSGLVYKSVYSLAIDSKNNIWAGTLNGISKFDGKTWTNYDPGNQYGTATFSIAIDSQGHKWCGGAYGVYEILVE